jgi:hypothetical protein
LETAPTQQLFHHLCIADARQHVGNRITHTHFAALYGYQLALGDTRDITSKSNSQFWRGAKPITERTAWTTVITQRLHGESD